MTELQPRLNIKFNVIQNFRRLWIMSHLSSQWDITRGNMVPVEFIFVENGHIRLLHICASEFIMDIILAKIN
ncbi:hypothetical protein BpHYR1_050764 [Brachionus plicatilis]|uniref:Uncharacterized protein n=1 Tax=Brachionus plicatilis TaxID=10195 RepID=A0A3M7P9G1_BRAPC|nr:hypothetical protein BpHYR1_050764 [Brachionus plicatilis]